jgi:type VI protein secretion system component VasF
MIRKSSRPAVPPQLTAAGREPHDRMAPVWAYVFLAVLLAVMVIAGFTARPLFDWLWEWIR